jgi:hypothetical protein
MILLRSSKFIFRLLRIHSTSLNIASAATAHPFTFSDTRRTVDSLASMLAMISISSRKAIQQTTAYSQMQKPTTAIGVGLPKVCRRSPRVAILGARYTCSNIPGDSFLIAICSLLNLTIDPEVKMYGSS